MADVSEWSAVEAENTHLDELTLSGESGLYINKVMCAVRAKCDEVDANVVHKTGAETVDGAKSFAVNPIIRNENPGISFKRSGSENTNNSKIISFDKDNNEESFSVTVNNSENVAFGVRYNGSGSSVNGALFSLVKNGSFSLRAKKGSGATEYTLTGDGDGSLQWNGQEIQTSSDARLKTAMADIPAVVLDAWETVQWGQFQFLAAVAAKGAASARLHVGLIAQAVKAAFDAAGLDACAYGILCHDVRPAEDDSPAVDVWTVRYAEAQAMEAACMRRKIARLEARIEALEAGLNGN